MRRVLSELLRRTAAALDPDPVPPHPAFVPILMFDGSPVMIRSLDIGWIIIEFAD
jgi:hypothetical protein